MKITRFLMFALLILSFAVVSTTFAQDEEPRLTLPIVDSGDTITNTFEDEVNAHLYVFLGSAGDLVTITMVQDVDSLLDPYLVLLGPAGEVYFADDDSGPELLSAQIDGFELPADGSYLVLATSFEGLRSGVDLDAEEPEPMSYELTVEGNNVPEGMESDEFEYFSGTMELGDSTVLELSSEEPVFYITFAAEEGDILSIETSDDEDGASIDTLLYLFDTEGNRIAVNDDSEEGLYSAIENIEIPEDGLYLVFGTAWNFDRAYTDEWDSAGTFVLTIE